jgi:hypothetical protein
MGASFAEDVIINMGKICGGVKIEKIILIRIPV